MATRYLEELLVEAGFISPQQLFHALEVQKGSNQRLSRVLVRLGYITIDKLIGFLSKQPNTVIYDLTDELFDKAALRLIPDDVAKKYKVIPINFIGGKIMKLFVCMAESSQLETIDTIAFMTGCDVEPVFITKENLEWLLQYFYHKRTNLVTK
jgi:type IV pilus assembly protein PilB